MLPEASVICCQAEAEVGGDTGTVRILPALQGPARPAGSNAAALISPCALWPELPTWGPRWLDLKE